MKKITVLFTVLLMLAASSAFAITVEAPAGLVNSTKFFAGFYSNTTANKYVAKDQATNATMMVFNSSANGFYSNGTQTSANTYSIASDDQNALYGNCTIQIWNGTAWKSTVTNGTMRSQDIGGGLNATHSWQTAQTFGNIKGVLTMGPQGNATNATTFFAHTAGHSFLVGIANQTANATNTGASPVVDMYGNMNGTTMSVLYNNGTIGGTVWSNTWDYYAYGMDGTSAQPVVMIGEVVLGTAGTNDNAQVKYSIVEAGARSHVTTAVTYNATSASNGNTFQLLRTAGEPLMTNGTVNADRNLICGYVITEDSDGDKLFVVMVKSGTTLATADLTNRAFKMVYSGAYDATKALGNATAGMMAYSVDGNRNIDGDMTYFNGTVDTQAVSLSGFSLALANTNVFATTQSNMTIYGTDGSTVAGSFYGKQAADKTMSVGIYEGENTGETGYNLAFIIPNPASTAAITAAGANYQNNSTLTLKGLILNSTAYSQVALRTQWTGIPSNFTPLTDVKGFNATYTASQKGDVYYTFQYQFTGVGDKVENLRLYKVFPTSAKTVRSYNYASAPSTSSDGAWWISTATADGYLNNNSVLAPGVEYYVNYVVKDNGNYDYKTTSKEIGDPVVLGSVPTTSSSSSSGCVFNPAASFGLEWLLLMLAPMVAIVRSRFKK
ncbi:hypothetical protein [Maridesulfovibrio frigidus]|uniref:hypothetical protein n=1 Tax=Maridesulfovibrio frigidus TaxID=340956 RepID=UPI0004E252C9|nr:hypothetical protein [Maridesulfovibrio frigidus]